MIYFDNAATTKTKPEEVYSAIDYYLREVGISPGRGSYQLGIEASRMLYKARTTVGKFFGMTNPERVVFTKNSTEAINLFFDGYLKKGDHVLISCYEHNAVLRPLQHLKNLGIIDYSVIERNDLDAAPEDLYKKYCKPNTKLIAFTLASNLSGRIIFRPEVYQYFHMKGITTFMDSSQGGGKIRPQMKTQYIDFLAFTGHKDLFGIPGSGGLCCESKVHFEPLIQGGTGIHGETYVNPDVFPEGYEAGTVNMPAIYALCAGIQYIERHPENIQKEEELTARLISGLQSLSNIVLFDPDVRRVPTCCFNVIGMSSDKVIAALDNKGICARGGIHCAILAHESLGTVKTGAVRLSINSFNSIKEVDYVLNVIANLR